MDAGFWQGRRVVVTGHTGFKGAWLSLWLERLGATVLGLALPPVSDDSAHPAIRPRLSAEVHCDIRDGRAVSEHLRSWKPEVVLHLAAQALVPASYRTPLETYETNVIGTTNTLAAACDAGARTVVVVTSDKVYRNDGSGRAFSEDDPLGGSDPYSASKACADLAAQSWRSLPAAAGTAIGVARAGNVLGGGDQGADRLLPDARRALLAGVDLELRRPGAVRPWQFVLEPLAGYLLLAQRLTVSPGDAPGEVNLGPSLDSCRAVQEVVELAHRAYGRGSWVATSGEPVAESAVLRLDASRAEATLGWTPRLDLETAIAWTVEWWKEADAGADMRALATRQIERFEAQAPTS